MKYAVTEPAADAVPIIEQLRDMKVGEELAVSEDEIIPHFPAQGGYRCGERFISAVHRLRGEYHVRLKLTEKLYIITRRA